MEFHEVANIFPMMADEEYTALVADIKEHGQLTPVWTYQGKIIDGRNRYKACQELGIEPQQREYTGDEAGLLSFVLSLNLQRRHLTSSQKAMLAVEVEGYLAKEAEKRMLAGKKADPAQKVVQGRASDQAAQIVGTNRQYVLDAKKIMEKAPEIGEAVRRGEISVSDAKAIASLPVEHRGAVLEKVKAGTTTSGRASHVAKDAIYEARKEAAAAEKAREVDERIRLSRTPEAQQEKENKQRQWLDQIREDRRIRQERETDLLTKFNAHLNDPDKVLTRAMLYEAAREANRLLDQGLREYLYFLHLFALLFDSFEYGQGNDRVTGFGVVVSWQQWGNGMEQPRGRAQWVKRQVETKYNGRFEDFVETLRVRFTETYEEMHKATGVPYVDFPALHQWIKDPIGNGNDDEEEPCITVHERVIKKLNELYPETLAAQGGKDKGTEEISA